MTSAIRAQLLAEAVPGYSEDLFKILAAWYFKKGKLPLEIAVEISGLNSTDDFKQFAKNGMKREKKPNNWVETGRFFFEAKQKKQYGEYGNFKSWSAQYSAYKNVQMHLRAFRLLSGSCAEKLTLQKAYLITRLPKREISRLIRENCIVIMLHRYEIGDLEKMDLIEFISLIRKGVVC